MLTGGISSAQAEAELERFHGRLRPALAAISK
jgi:hypothetical protein